MDFEIIILWFGLLYFKYIKDGLSKNRIFDVMYVILYRIFLYLIFINIDIF